MSNLQSYFYLDFCDPDTIDYPFLGYYTGFTDEEVDQIILFTDYKVGTVVWSKMGLSQIGHHGRDWNMENFKVFKGSVTLTGK